MVDRVQQPDLGFGLFQRRALGQRAPLLPFGLLHRITVFSWDFTNYIRHYIYYLKEKTAFTVLMIIYYNQLKSLVL